MISLLKSFVAFTLNPRRNSNPIFVASLNLPLVLLLLLVIIRSTANPRRNWGDTPLDLLLDIMSRLGLKANIRASAMCKTWLEASVSVRKSQPRPWLFYPSENGTYTLFDTLGHQTYTQNYPELEKHDFYYSRDGWLLFRRYYPRALFLLNPFTRDCIQLPKESGDYYISAFSAAPTSTSCLVFLLLQVNSYIEIKTWRPGATVWTNYRFEKQIPGQIWTRLLFLNGMFYCLTTYGYLGVFDPSRETWNNLPVKPCPAFKRFKTPVSMTEHEGDIFVMYIPDSNNNPSVFKLNLERKVWEEKRDFGGLTVFASHYCSLTRYCLSAEERNRVYFYGYEGNKRYYYSLGDEESSHSPPTYFRYTIAWVDPPHNNFNI